MRTSHHDLLTYLSTFSPRLNLPLSDEWDGPYHASSWDHQKQVARRIYDRVTEDPGYALLAGRYLAYALEQYVSGRAGASFLQRSTSLAHAVQSNARRFAPNYLNYIQQHAVKIEGLINRDRDFTYDYFALLTGIQTYLIKDESGHPLESIQDLHMRVAIQIALGGVVPLEDAYEDLSQKYYTHATPTMISAGYENPHLSSCFLLYPEDSLESIFDTYKQTAILHKGAGGCSIGMQAIRSTGAWVQGTGGASSGSIQFVLGFEHTATSVTAGGRRPASSVVWMEPHHPDVYEFIMLRTGKLPKKVHHLNLGLMLNDTFRDVLEQDGEYYLLDPSLYPGLDQLTGHAYRQQYEAYAAIAKEKLAAGTTRQILGDCAVIHAADLWHAIKESKALTGLPYLMNKDAINRLSNESHLGPTRISNLCCEIVQHCDPEHTAVCVLGSLNLPSYVTDQGYDYGRLHEKAYRLCKNLNAVLDMQVLGTEAAQRGAQRSRAIGIGIQGLADVFLLMGLCYESDEAMDMNRRIAETIQHGAWSASSDLAALQGPYPSYEGSPMSQGKFHHERAGYTGTLDWDWETLRQHIAQHGVRNSYVTAYMPTSTTSAWLGNTESFEPIMSAALVRNTNAGAFTLLHRQFVKDLKTLGLWTRDLLNQLVMANGKVELLPGLPMDIQQRYKSAWSISTKRCIDMAAARQPFICQAQSLNYYVENPTSILMNSIFFYAWKRGLKTISYYLHTREAASAPKLHNKTYTEEEKELCRRNAETGKVECVACSS